MDGERVGKDKAGPEGLLSYGMVVTALFPPELRAITVIEPTPPTVGVPEISPVAELILKPGVRLTAS